MAIDRPLFSVFPTCVGVIPNGRLFQAIDEGIPHMRGGDPNQQQQLQARILYSPRK